MLPTDNQEMVRTKRLLTAALLISIPTSIISAVMTALTLGAPGAGAVILIAPIGNTIALTWVRVRPKAYPGVMHFVAAFNMIISLTIVALSGGLLSSGINAVWGVLSVLGAMVVFADRRALAWMFGYLVATVIASVWGHSREPHPSFTLNDAETQGLINLSIVAAFVFLVL